MADWYNAGGEFYSYISLHFTAYCRGREDLIIGQKDIVEKHLEEYNDVFADIVNVLLFDGKEIISPNALEDTQHKAQYKSEDSILHEMERDTVKRWTKDGTVIALYGIENQSKAEKYMPIRLFGYDGISYRSQLNDKKMVKVHPVISIVLYFGKGHWNQPKKLKKVLSIPDELEEYVNDYKIHVFEISWLKDEQVNMFKSDFRIVADFFTQIRKNNDYVPSTTTIEHVDAVLKLLTVFGHEDKLMEMIEMKKSKEVKNMGEVIHKFVEEGILEGKATALINATENLQKNMGLSLEEALNAIGQSMESYNKAKLLIG